MMTIKKAIGEASRVQLAAFEGMLRAKTNEDRMCAFAMWNKACKEAQAIEDAYLGSKRS